MLGARHPVLLRGMAGQVVVVRWTPHCLFVHSVNNLPSPCAHKRRLLDTGCVFLIMWLHEVPLLLRTALPNK